MERFAAWIVTGPLGHLVAGVADWVTMLVRWRLEVHRQRRRGPAPPAPPPDRPLAGS